jgi:hypothetical protein
MGEISREPQGENFLLRLKETGSHDIELVLSPQNVLALANTAPSFRQSIMARDYPPGAVFATPVAQLRAVWDALGENVLLELRFRPDGSVIFELDPALGQRLPEDLRELDVDKPASPMTRQ